MECLLLYSNHLLLPLLVLTFTPQTSVYSCFSEIVHSFIVLNSSSFLLLLQMLLFLHYLVDYGNYKNAIKILKAGLETSNLVELHES